MRTARDVPTPLMCRNSMISRITFCSAQPAMIRSATLWADPGYLAQARRLLLDDVEHGITKGAHQLLGIDRPDARIMPEPRYFSIPSTVVGAVALRKEALNWTPWVRSLTQLPLA